MTLALDPTLTLIDVGSMFGIEIGPLANPRIRKDQGRVKYLDHTDTDGLRSKYSTNPPMMNRLNDIVEVDYVVEGSVSETVAADAPFDYVVASHVIEHIPDLIGWMADISLILKMGGVLSLVIPDKRYCFDVNRSLTSIGDLVDAYLIGRRQPSIRDIYNFHSQIVTMDGAVDTAGLWAGTANYDGVVRTDVEDPDVEAYRIAQYAVAAREFVDVHCHVFTPSSFEAIFDALVRLGLTDFAVANLCPTRVDTLEFFVSLRKVRSSGVVPLTSYSDIPNAHSPCLPGLGAESSHMQVSDKERSALLLKRRIMEGIRRRSCRG